MAKARKSTQSSKAPKSSSKKKTSRTKPTPRQRATPHSGAKKTPARATAPPAATQKTPTVESVARKIVRVTSSPASFKLADLYAETCTSLEPGATEPVVGLKGLEEKATWWASIREHESWKARTVWIKGNQVAIQWDAEVTFRDGRNIEFSEMAVYQIRGGKIVSERYYYDPSIFAPPAEQAEPTPAEPPPRPRGPENRPLTGTPPLDPMDV